MQKIWFLCLGLEVKRFTAVTADDFTHGHFPLFEKMEREYFHNGELKESKGYFHRLKRKYGIK
jgi:hypothetical protein